MTNKYPCEVHVGDYIVLRTGAKLKVSEVDWKYIYIEDGRKFSFRHPDIAEVCVEEPVVECEAVKDEEETQEEIQEEPAQEEEAKGGSKKKSKKATEEKKEDEE